MLSQNFVTHASETKHISSLGRGLACIQITPGLKFSLNTRSDRYFTEDSRLLGCDALPLGERFLPGF
jgi:hypothetical protein